MKLTVIYLYLATIGICLANNVASDGKPDCNTLETLGQLYRNFWDPTKYWRCVALNGEPILDYCMDGTAFDAAQGRCISWFDWVWTPPVMPASQPYAADSLPVAVTQGLNIPNQQNI